MNNDSTNATSNENREASTLSWRDRFEELLKVKNVDELKTELTKLAHDVQTEMQHFDLQEYLSPQAKQRLKELESRYTTAMKSVQKAQKQFDREFSKNMRNLKKTRAEAEKRFSTLKSQVEVQKKKIVKATNQLKSRLVKKAKTKAKAKKGRAKNAK